MSRVLSDEFQHSIDHVYLSDQENDINQVDTESLNSISSSENQISIINEVEIVSLYEGRSSLDSYAESDHIYLPVADLSDRVLMCPICYDTKLLTAFGYCLHYFCKDCIRNFLIAELSNFSSASMKCPTCEGPYLLRLAQELLPEDQYQKFNKLQKIFQLKESEKMFQWCPAGKCEGYAIATWNNFNIVCNVCSLKFCYNCLKPWHNKRCGTRRGISYAVWAFIHNVKKCPKCKSQTQKHGGCFHMTCQNCKYEYCWTCGVEYDSSHISKFCYFGKSVFELNCWFIFVLLIFPVAFPFIFVILYDYILQTNGFNANQDILMIRLLNNRVFMIFSLFVFGPFILFLLLIVFYTVRVLGC